MEGQNNRLGHNLGVGSTEQKAGPIGESEESDAPNEDDGLNNCSSVPTNVEMDSDYDKPYEYESKTFNSPISFEDEGRTAYDSFSEDTKYGEVVFKIEHMFSTMNLCFQVKTLIDEHTCARDYGSNMVDRGWVASKLIKKLLIYPDMKPRQAMDHMIEDYNVHLNPRMIAKKLKVARHVFMDNARAQYSKVRNYLSELHRSNPKSTILMDTIPQPESLPLFDRLYISLDVCKRGFKQGCGPLIGQDGCFLKGYYGGHLLSAVGKDANNYFFVIAYVVVLNECKETWNWFSTFLQEDLGDVTQHGWNFISDQQKGLKLAIKYIMPNVHRRNCVLHIWKNFKKYFKDQQAKQMVWECARCTTFQEFNQSMEKINHGPKVDNITNNICEVWNAKIVEYRGKPILTMCEDLRCYLMRKMATHKKKLETHPGHLALVQQKKLDDIIKPSTNKWREIWAGDSDRVLLEVHRGGSKVGVNLVQRTYTCNVWQLTILYKIGLRPEEHVHKWLTIDSIRATYIHFIKSVNSEEYWIPCDAPRTKPPIIKRPAHRPK
ncbi:uncharacterized protein LOC107615943 [Arachis ipaensis]|uniref:uncharacterized protein LOC107615943 n=1 Tax=Arachis ipaensis TaxID=130454 RepID=UPI0007AF1E88|nr:uncharacterized protein LOC107615943 [Arachis ipaensis]XP_025678868.1 uncharacterized protein LOC112778797 [Arachis hypogaea]